MESSIKKLSRSNILSLTAYKSARNIGGMGSVFLNANEYPISTIYNFKHVELNRYPACQSKKLIFKYSVYSGINKKNILVSRGSDESIELLMRVFCQPNLDSIITCPPTYLMYSKIAEIYGINNIVIPMINNHNLDFYTINKFIDQAKLIYICRPNNPTGHIFKIQDILNLLCITYGKMIVVIDEAYIDFCMHNNLSYLLCSYPHLVILRTLSKAFALAGIRCGFTLAHDDIIFLLKKVITPYPLPIPTIDIAIKALSFIAVQIMKNRISILHRNKLWLFKNLKNIFIVEKLFHSTANYILVKFFYSQYVFRTLWNKGIILRNQDHEIKLMRCIRISVGTMQECLRLVLELKQLM